MTSVILLNAAAPHLGGARIRTTQWDVVQHRAPPATTRSGMSAGLLTVVLSLCFGAAIATAAPAGAVDDAGRPHARVTHGPSCRPGGLVVEVVGGTVPYSVRLATTRTPSGEDEAVVLPGQTIELRSGDVGWGEPIDGRLEFRAGNGSGDSFVDELEDYNFTRPTKEDCDAVAAVTSPHPSPSTSAGPSNNAAGPSGVASTAAVPAPTTTPTGSAEQAGGGPGGEGTPVQRVVAGSTVRLSASGFRPGERVTITLDGADAVLAGVDGTVQAQVRIPTDTAAGRVSVVLVGEDSAVVTVVELRVVAASSAVEAGADSATGRPGDGAGDLVPLTAAAAALVLTLGALASVAGRHRSDDRSAPLA